MAVALAVDVPDFDGTLGMTYVQYTYTAGRNLLLTIDGDVFYHPNGSGKDGQAVDASERFKIVGPTTLSLRLPGSGSGRRAVANDGNSSGPTTESGSFALASVTGTTGVYCLIVNENVSK